MFDFLRALGLKPLEFGRLVAETAKGAPYIGEVLDHAFEVATAVVVLFTPDVKTRSSPSWSTYYVKTDTPSNWLKVVVAYAEGRVHIVTSYARRSMP